MAFVLSQRLHWSEPVKASAAPFEDPSDLKILWNDWPYGIDPKIVHLVVWTKFDLEDDAETDDLTPKARQEIDDYVNKTFCSKMPKEHVSSRTRDYPYFGWDEMFILIIHRLYGLRIGGV